MRNEKHFPFIFNGTPCGIADTSTTQPNIHNTTSHNGPCCVNYCTIAATTHRQIWREHSLSLLLCPHVRRRVMWLCKCGFPLRFCERSFFWILQSYHLMPAQRHIEVLHNWCLSCFLFRISICAVWRLMEIQLRPVLPLPPHLIGQSASRAMSSWVYWVQLNTFSTWHPNKRSGSERS